MECTDKIRDFKCFYYIFCHFFSSAAQIPIQIHCMKKSNNFCVVQKRENHKMSVKKG